MNTGITLTPAAADHVSRYIERRGKGLGLRLGVTSSGCSGFTYKVEFADVVEQDDTEFDSNGVRIFVDRLSLPLLAGTELDFVNEGLSAGFRFNNPNAAGECGCGESFKVQAL